jgi:hypothetical protein
MIQLRRQVVKAGVGVVILAQILQFPQRALPRQILGIGAERIVRFRLRLRRLIFRPGLALALVFLPRPYQRISV